MRLEGRRALVTGGASGIGAAICARLAAEGAEVWVGDIDIEGAQRVAGEIGGHAVALDVTDHEAAGAAVEAAGTLDVLVNNAGADEFGFFTYTTPEQWQRVIAINLVGVLNCTHAALPGMQQAGHGRIVSISSEAGRVGSKGSAVYSAAKGGIVAFMKAIARENARYGITANSVAPGPIETPLLIGVKGFGEIGEKVIETDAPQGATSVHRSLVPAMGGTSDHRIDRDERSAAAWRLARGQRGLLTRKQLASLGFGRHEIEHRLATGRLRPVARGVYAVGRPPQSREERWMAAVLTCGEGAALSHGSAGALLGIGMQRPGVVEVSTPSRSRARHPGLIVHRRSVLRLESVGRYRGIPVTSPVQTLIDIAPRSTREEIERAVSEADLRGLVTVPALRAALGSHPGEPGVAILRRLIDHRTFRRTRSWLERRFLPLAERAGLPAPLTRQWVNGFEVDFFWPQLGFLVETDGGRTHRTPFQQAKDRRRDQVHTAAGLVHLRFTHDQIEHEPEYVLRILVETKRLLPGPAAVTDA